MSTLALSFAAANAQARAGADPVPGVVQLELHGLNDEQAAMVLPALEIATYRTRTSIGERRLQRLLGQVEAEVDVALEVVG